MPSRKYATSEQVDNMHDCLDKFKQKTEVELAVIKTNQNNMSEKLDRHIDESKQSRKNVYDKLAEIKETLAVDHAKDEYRDKAIASSNKAKSSSPVDKAIAMLRERAILAVIIVLLGSVGGFPVRKY